MVPGPASQGRISQESPCAAAGPPIIVSRTTAATTLLPTSDSLFIRRLSLHLQRFPPSLAPGALPKAGWLFTPPSGMFTLPPYTTPGVRSDGPAVPTAYHCVPVMSREICAPEFPRFRACPTRRAWSTSNAGIPVCSEPVETAEPANGGGFFSAADPRLLHRLLDHGN